MSTFNRTNLVALKLDHLGLLLHTANSEPRQRAVIASEEFQTALAGLEEQLALMDAASPEALSEHLTSIEREATALIEKIKHA